MDDTALVRFFEHEHYWKDHYHWLYEQGYQLRPRYHPEWIPSWRTNPALKPSETEDAHATWRHNVMDATRLADGSHVVIKLVAVGPLSEEYDIIRYLNEEPQKSDPRNHCVPLLDTLYPSDDKAHVMIVSPILRQYDDPEFDTVGEALDSIREILEGLTFLHEHRIVHRDIRSSNYMMNPHGMYTTSFNCGDPNRTFDMSRPISLYQQSPRTGLWPKYYIIDFEHSQRYKAEDMPPLELPRRATDNSAPEFERGALSDPFPIDVYRFGNLIDMDFISGNNPTRRDTNSPGLRGFDFLLPLVKAMTKNEPRDRVTMHQALELFDKLVSELPYGRLRSRVAPQPRSSWTRRYAPSDAWLTSMYLWRRARYSLTGVAAMRPVPRARPQLDSL